ncbi:MAG: hypothetical protein HC925_01925 [Coleofasciculaceae cyanobacterium SM2_3_26]|nr:hypothetical protein [Coleofasciculaceae cyanobacterium SM2_3_26]
MSGGKQLSGTAENWRSALGRFVRLSGRSRVYDFSERLPGHDYMFDPTSEGRGGYITSSGRMPNRGDRILLLDGGEATCYEVEEVECYRDRPDMWTALLKKI